MILTRSVEDVRALVKRGGEVHPIGRGVTVYRTPWVDGMAPLELRQALVDAGLPAATRVHLDPTTNELVLAFPLDDEGGHHDTVAEAVKDHAAGAPARLVAASEAKAAFEAAIEKDGSPSTASLEAM